MKLNGKTFTPKLEYKANQRGQLNKLIIIIENYDKLEIECCPEIKQLEIEFDPEDGANLIDSVKQLNETYYN